MTSEPETVPCPKCGVKVTPRVTVEQVGPEPWRTFKVPMQETATDTTSIYDCVCAWWELRSRTVRLPL